MAIGVRVFLRARDDRVAGMVTAILHEPGSLQYRVMWGTASVTWHYAFELSTQYVPTFKDA